MTVFDFPQFSCQIHAHFTDEDREAIALSKIVPYSRGEKDSLPIDNYTLAMLRHYAEESGALSAKAGRSQPTTKKQRKRLLAFWAFTGVLLLFLITMIFINEEDRAKESNREFRYVTVKETIHAQGCVLEPGIKYDTAPGKPPDPSNKNVYGYYLIGRIPNSENWSDPRSTPYRFIFVPEDKIDEIFLE